MIPIYFTIVTLVSMGVGSMLGHIFKLRRSQRYDVCYTSYTLSNTFAQELRHGCCDVHEL